MTVLSLGVLECASLEDWSGNYTFNRVKCIEGKMFLFLKVKMISRWEWTSELFHLQPQGKA